VDGTHTIVVSLPAAPEHLHILRTVVAAVAARADFRVDEIEDLKLAVGESVTQLLRAGPARTIDLTLRLSPASLEAVAAVDTPPAGPWPPREYQTTLAWQVLQGLTDETTFLEDGTTSLRFVKRRS
jgi:serine/threonine-protein kinase RsbW